MSPGVRQPPLHALIGEVGEGMAERRQFPIEHGEQARAPLRRRSYCRCASRHGPARPARRRRACSRRARRSVGPCRGAASSRWRDIARPSAAIAGRNNCPACRKSARPAAATSTRVQRRERLVHRIVDRAALGMRQAGQRRVPEDAALDIGHEIEHRADDALVLAQRERARAGKADCLQARAAREIRARPYAPISAACRAACGAGRSLRPGVSRR